MPGRTGPRVSWFLAPIPLLHPSIFWGFASPGKVCPWVLGRAVVYRSTTEGLGRTQLCDSACGTLPGTAGLQQLLLKKRWKIKESRRGYCWVLIAGTAKAGKGLTEQMKPVSLMYKLVH